VGNHLAKHVPVVLTITLLVPQVVHILQLLVPLEPMPVEQQPFVIYVVLGNTMVNKDKQVVPHVVLGNTMDNKDKLLNLVVNHAVLGNTTNNTDNQVVHRVVLENTMTKQVKLLNQLLVKVAMRENTKTKREKHPATTIVLAPW
jgi:hypothetical protein